MQPILFLVMSRFVARPFVGHNQQSELLRLDSGMQELRQRDDARNAAIEVAVRKAEKRGNERVKRVQSAAQADKEKMRAAHGELLVPCGWICSLCFCCEKRASHAHN